MLGTIIPAERGDKNDARRMMPVEVRTCGLIRSETARSIISPSERSQVCSIGAEFYASTDSSASNNNNVLHVCSDDVLASSIA